MPPPLEPQQQRSLFDVEDAVGTPPRVRDMHIGPVSAEDVREFCRRYHYSGTGESAIRRWGLWHGDILYGVVSYSPAPYGLPQAAFGPDCPVAGMWNMHRLALADSSPHNSESRLIAGSLRAMHDRDTTIWAVVTYAATDAGHIGYVYQATNALYTGTGGQSTFYLAADGTRRATYATGKNITPTAAAERGWTVHQGGAKHRYIYLLGDRRQRRDRRAALRWDVMPYPKGTDGFAD